MHRSDRIREIRRTRRKRRVRRRVRGTDARPRLSVHRSHKAIYVQAIDDLHGVTVAASSSLDPELRAKLDGKKGAVAKVVGGDIAKRLTDKGIKAVVFDRGWYKFHGRVAALAEGAREGGLAF